MREFGSGILGCIICVLALMGSILGGFCLGVESETRDVTNYDYKTDLTGTFATENAPEYIDYSPAANFTGYLRNSVDYTQSSTANAFRYIVSYPLDQEMTKQITQNDFFPSSNDFLTNSPGTQLVLNVTGGGYNYGTAKTVDSLTYNVFTNSGTYNGDSIPKVTQLSSIIETYRNMGNEVTVDITNYGDHPVLMTANLPTRTDYRDTTHNNTWFIYNGSISAHPTRIVWNTVIDSVNVYNGSTLLFSSTLNNTMVYYSYQYNAGGTPAQAGINATLSASGRATALDTVSYEDSYPPVYSSVTVMGINNTAAGHGYPTTPTQSAGNLQYNVIAASESITRLTDIMATIPNLPSNGNVRLQLSYLSFLPDVMIINSNDVTDYGGYKGTTTTEANYPKYIDYNAGNGACTVYYNNGANSWSSNINNLFVVYKPVSADGNATVYNTTATFIFAWDVSSSSVTVRDNNSYSYPLPIRSTASNAKTSVLIDWDGIRNMGSDKNYAGMAYNIEIYKVADKSNVSTLFDVLENLGIEYFSSIDFEIIYDSTLNPVLIYGGNFTRNDLTIGNSTQYVYTATMDENNSMPDRIVVANGIASVFKNSTLQYTKPINEIYVMNKYYADSTTTLSGTKVTFNGTASTDTVPLSYDVDNNSSFASDGYSFSLPNAEHPGSPTYMRPLLQYTGTQFNNMGETVTFNAIGKSANICLSEGDAGDSTYYLTKFTNILNAININDYNDLELDITYGTHPIIFIRGAWEYYHSHQTASDQGGTVHYYYNYYWQSIDDTAFPDKIRVDKIVGRVTAYKNNLEIWSVNTNDLQVAYKYWTLDDLGAYNAFSTEPVTDQAMNLSGIAKLKPTYAYADPSKGVTLKTPFTEWRNGYSNNEINITVTKQNWGNNDLTIAAGDSSIQIERRSAGGLYVTINKYDGTAETRNMGNWYSAQITINASEGWIAVTPIAGSGNPNFTNKIDLNDTTVIWDGWYNGENIGLLTFTSSGDSLRWSITDTSVFLNTYGIVMYNPSIDVTEYFPEMEEWRLNFFSFALVGDSVTINNQTFPVNTATQTITVIGTDGETVSGELSNVYITQENDHTYFSFANSKKTIDLGETVSNTVSFNGMWYFTTGLFDITQGTEQFYDWQLDGNLHATVPQMCLMFIGVLIAALIVCKAILRFDIGAIDWIILISATVISLLIAGGNL